MDKNDSSSEAQDSQTEDLQTQQSKLADQLSELSQVDVFPIGFKAVADPFEIDDVDFNSSSWLLRVLQVQVWLYPNTDIDARRAETAPLDCARALFSAIGAEVPEHCAVGVDVVGLTPEGAELLGGRLDTAVALQQAFRESLETLNRKQATEQWRESWEEEDDATTAAPEPIKAKSETWRISDFSGKASLGKLNLTPSYQRGDVWPTRDAQKLIESILRGIPLPSIILLRPARGNKLSNYEVVDGKQRLTSILRFTGQHPQATKRVKEMDEQFPDANLAKHFRDDYKKFRRQWKSVVGESLTDKREAEYYFPFRLALAQSSLPGPLRTLAGKYHCEIRGELVQIGDGQETVADVFEGPSDYKIPLIEYLDATPKQIQEVFHLYNKQGKHLNAEEIRNARFHDVDLVRLVLVASGDNPSAKDLAPYIPADSYGALRRIAKCLSDYRFGSARYKRTKVLSWLLALLFQPSVASGALAIRSTAKQIDSLLSTIRDTPGNPHPLADHVKLVDLVRDTDRCLEAHSSADCWDARFKDDDKGQKWQELQLVASLLAVFLLGRLEEAPGAVLASHRDALLEFTRSHPRPENTQNKTQWAFIGEVALGVLNVLGVDEQRLEASLVSQYGTSCLPTLRAARPLYRSRAIDRP